MIKCSISDFTLMAGFRYKKKSLPVVLCLIDISTCSQSQKVKRQRMRRTVSQRKRSRIKKEGAGECLSRMLLWGLYMRYYRMNY